MKTKAKSGHVELKVEDAQRLQRLSEEIRSRLFEIALILSHSGGKKIPRGTLNFGSSKRPVPAMGGSGDWMEIVEGKDGGVACYGVMGGEPFYENPCGS